MNPWTIIGWAVIAVVVLVALFVLLAFVVALWRGVVAPRWRSLRTRHIPPAAGQVWRQNGGGLRIKRITDEGRVVIQSGSASWSDSPEEWRERLRFRHVYLESAP